MPYKPNPEARGVSRKADREGIGQAIVELDGKSRQVNAALTKLTGYPEAQLLKLTFQDITHPDDLELDLGHKNELVAGAIGSYQIEKRYFTASG
ncbi:MAG: PAS domain S-box protein, partial [Chloroflexota bacterium]|nr:PAS domain S-box protein [Chloroflexota bacterium]